MILLDVQNIQYTCREAAQQLHHTSHPTDSHSERHTEASRVNALLKGTLTELPPGQKKVNPNPTKSTHSSTIGLHQQFEPPLKLKHFSHDLKKESSGVGSAISK
jgi:hypothetical protein